MISLATLFMVELRRVTRPGEIRTGAALAPQSIFRYTAVVLDAIHRKRAWHDRERKGAPTAKKENDANAYRVNSRERTVRPKE